MGSTRLTSPQFDISSLTKRNNELLAGAKFFDLPESKSDEATARFLCRGLVRELRAQGQKSSGGYPLRPMAVL